MRAPTNIAGNVTVQSAVCFASGMPWVAPWASIITREHDPACDSSGTRLKVAIAARAIVAGSRQSRLTPAWQVCFWHFADIFASAEHVRFRGVKRT
jgi:hypothetical protein